MTGTAAVCARATNCSASSTSIISTGRVVGGVEGALRRGVRSETPPPRSQHASLPFVFRMWCCGFVGRPLLELEGEREGEAEGVIDGVGGSDG